MHIITHLFLFHYANMGLFCPTFQNQQGYSQVPQSSLWWQIVNGICEEVSNDTVAEMLNMLKVIAQ